MKQSLPNFSNWVQIGRGRDGLALDVYVFIWIDRYAPIWGRGRAPTHSKAADHDPNNQDTQRLEATSRQNIKSS